MKTITRVIIMIIAAIIAGLFIYVYAQPEKEYGGTFVREYTIRELRI